MRQQTHSHTLYTSIVWSGVMHSFKRATDCREKRISVGGSNPPPESTLCLDTGAAEQAQGTPVRSRTHAGERAEPRVVLTHVGIESRWQSVDLHIGRRRATDDRGHDDLGGAAGQRGSAEEQRSAHL